MDKIRWVDVPLKSINQKIKHLFLFQDKSAVRIPCRPYFSDAGNEKVWKMGQKKNKV